MPVAPKCSQVTDPPGTRREGPWRDARHPRRRTGTSRQEGPFPMPMIDVYAAAGTFADEHQLAQDLATAVMTIEQVPDIAMFRKNTAAFVHDLDAGSLANAGALDRDKQIAVVRRLTDIIAAAAGDPTLGDRTWVLLTEAPEGGWGLWGHAHTNAELVSAARAEIAALTKDPAGT